MRDVPSAVSTTVLFSALSMAGPVAHAQAANSAAPNVHAVANKDSSLRILVSVARRTLWVVIGASDTLLTAPVAVGSDRALSYGGHRWTFHTPRGVQTVLSKEENPVWIPPDWHYVEVARSEKLALVWLRGDTTIALPDGSSLVMRDLRVSVRTDSTNEELGGGEEIVLGNTLFVPPIGSPNRRVPGELGKYRLLLGEGVGIHGTPDTGSIGHAVTHGCMRLRDADLSWLYEHVPVDTHVYIF